MVCITNLLIPPNNCNSSGKVFVTNLLTSLENITPVVSVYHWFTDASLGNIYTIYTSTITVGTRVPNLLAPFISTKREYRLVVGIQPLYIVVIYFNFSCASSLTSGIAKGTKLSKVSIATLLDYLTDIIYDVRIIGSMRFISWIYWTNMDRWMATEYNISSCCFTCQ